MLLKEISIIFLSYQKILAELIVILMKFIHALPLTKMGVR